MKKIVIILFLIIVLGGGIFAVLINTLAKGSFESVTSFSKPRELKSDNGRTNFLIVGVDTRDTKYLQTGTLTDSMIVASVDFNNSDVKLLSMPRDLWIDRPGFGLKINEIYTIKGFDDLKATIEDLLDIEVHYTAEVNFLAFEKIIDTIGGIEINNPYAFTDYRYPKFGWENETCGIDIEKLKEEKEEKGESLSDEDFLCRYETISFKEGLITLSGETALKYARSRHSIDAGQGSDFARAKRQHLVMTGIKDKILSSSTLSNPVKLKDLYYLFQELVKTNLTNEEFVTLIPKAPTLKDIKISSAVLTDGPNVDEGGVLVRGNPDLYNGRYVLVPKEVSSIKSFATSYFFSTTNLTPTPNE